MRSGQPAIAQFRNQVGRSFRRNGNQKTPGGLRIEEGFHVTSTGAEPLQQLSRVIEL